MHADGARAAFLGLALGDAYGRSLEFVRGERVRTRPVVVPSADFMWTDDTHMSLYLVDALDVLGADALRCFPADDFGRAVGHAFVAWSHDPLTPSTAPGNTCLQGASAFESSRDWRRSGVRQSDGCGAVMRVVPLPVVLQGQALVTAARVQAVVTHAHENAPSTAIAACLMVRELLDGAALDADLVTRTLRRMAALGVLTDSVRGALEAAVVQAARRELTWLDEDAIPDGDGGWRSPSALGLGLVAALRWGDDFGVAIDKAARIDGDSDSVACLAGMLIGAARGMSALPARWLAGLPQRERIDSAVDRLLALVPDVSDVSEPPGEALDASEFTRVRTSQTDPIEVAWLPVEVGERGGRLGVTFAPGKHAPSTLGRPWKRNLATDLVRLRNRHQVDMLVSLVEDSELDWLQIGDLCAAAEAQGLAVLRHPVVDGAVPVRKEADRTVQHAVSLARAGWRVVFHCRGGLGRAGTFAAMALRRLGLTGKAAMSTVREVRPGAIENALQERFVVS